MLKKRIVRKLTVIIFILGIIVDQSKGNSNESILVGKERVTYQKGNIITENRMIPLKVTAENFSMNGEEPDIIKSAIDNKLVPYSTSNLGFLVDIAKVKAADCNIKKVKKFSCTLNTQPEVNVANRSIIFDKDGGNIKAKVAVLSKRGIDKITGKSIYEYDKTLSSYCKSTIVGDEIKLTFDAERELNSSSADFELVVYIQTKDATQDGRVPKMNDYKSRFKGDQLKFTVKDVQVLAEYQVKKIDLETERITPSSSIEKVITLPNHIIEAVYCEIPQIV